MTTQANINAAVAVLKQFTKTYGATASDTMLSSAVYSINAALGYGGAPAAEYHDAVKEAGGIIPATTGITRTEEGSFEVQFLAPPIDTNEPALRADAVEEFDSKEKSEAFKAEHADTIDKMVKKLPKPKRPVKSEADLKKLTKAQIVAQAEAEGINNIDLGDPGKKELIARLLAGRDQT